MNPWINYHHLNYFRVIAKSGSISKASEALRIGQPALSAQLKQFEENIGAQLFERKHKKLTLTEAGIIALEYAEEIFKLGDELIEVLHDKIIPQKPHLQIGALDSVSKDIIFKISKYAIDHFNCTISLLEGSMPELLRELNGHKIDLIVSNYIPHSETEQKLYSKHISKIPVHLYGGKKFSKLQHDFPHSLNDQPLILPTGHSQLKSDLLNYFKSQNININKVAETQDTALQMIFGIEGYGLLPLSESTAEPYIKNKSLYKIGKLDHIVENIYLLSKSRKIENHISGNIIRNFKL